MNFCQSLIPSFQQVEVFRSSRKSSVSPDEETFDSWGFYYGRMTRILPVYIATWLFALALTPLGHNHDSGNLKNAIWGGFASVYGIQGCQISH